MLYLSMIECHGHIISIQKHFYGQRKFIKFYIAFDIISVESFYSISFVPSQSPSTSNAIRSYAVGAFGRHLCVRADFWIMSHFEIIRFLYIGYALNTVCHCERSKSYSFFFYQLHPQIDFNDANRHKKYLT